LGLLAHQRSIPARRAQRSRKQALAVRCAKRAKLAAIAALREIKYATKARAVLVMVSEAGDTDYRY